MDDTDDLNRSAGLRLRQLRKNAGLTPSDLMHRLAAKGIKLHPVQIGRIEDSTRVLRLDEAKAVAEVFGIEIAALIEGTDDLELAALELQQQDALDALDVARATHARFNRAFREFQRQMTKIENEVEHYKGVVHDLEQRMANIRDGDDEEA